MIKAYEDMLENIKAFEAAQEADNGQLEAAEAEAEQARQRYNALLEKALEDPELAADIAETKLQRLRANLDAVKKPYPDGMAVAFRNVQAEIRRRIADGSLLREEFQPLLDKLKEHMQGYTDTLATVFVKMHQVNKSLAHIQHSTASAVLRYTGKEERFGLMGPELIKESDFKEWAWVDHYQYNNDLAAIRKAALEETSPEVKLPPAYQMPNVLTVTRRESEQKTYIAE
ncbi:hypothetical protein [Paenibacillus naphthalenovorans]|uniref:Uncharacterized protein n=1 Tax=Paenibacillus naphthalenovorans TaxID=162209 RepID=A0A0U2W656_9BACL|nr:hypothetical protein [Paenibacillus naphthalenovorans]ALS24052.1 hypothetical protein IJ22_37140 [Paenibacillus naphthalenovorans]SDJ75227.1 hypothetical protein SAMN05421868_14227 [Paenibacillus naphthalenovorans]